MVRVFLTKYMDYSMYKYNYSVIIPHFTRDGNTHTLCRAVDSVPERKDIQVFVVDNSLTPIPNNLFSYRRNVKILYSPNQRKAGGARNVGIENSNAKWFLFLDADDFFTEKAFDSFDKFLYSDYDLVFSLKRSVYGDDISKPAHRGDYTSNLVREFIRTGNDTDLRINYPSPCAKMVRSSLVIENSIRYDEVPASNDVMFALKVGLAAKKIGADAVETYTVTTTAGSITRTRSLENIESVFFVRERYNKMLKENGYRPNKSEMICIVRSAKYGIKPFLKLSIIALKSGNLFNGWSNWVYSFFHQFSKQKRTDDAKYNVKE